VRCAPGEPQQLMIAIKRRLAIEPKTHELAVVESGKSVIYDVVSKHHPTKFSV